MGKASKEVFFCLEMWYKALNLAFHLTVSGCIITGDCVEFWEAVVFFKYIVEQLGKVLAAMIAYTMQRVSFGSWENN